MSIFYLSLPVFSHWQGRLDPRVMILGRRSMVGSACGRGHHASASLDAVTLLPVADTRMIDPMTKKTDIAVS